MNTGLLQFFAKKNEFIYKSTDYGATFNALSFRPITAMDWSAIAGKPDGSVILVASQNTEIGGGYLYSTTDQGENFTPTSLGANHYIHALAMCSDIAYSTVLAGGNGLFISTDNGATWSGQVLALQDLRILGCAINSTGTIMLVVASGGLYSGAYRSTDSGSTWTLLTNGIPNGNGIAFQCCAMSDDGQVMLVGQSEIDANNFGGLWRSEDGGDSWTQTNVPFVASVAISPDGTFAAAVYLYNGITPGLWTGTGNNTWVHNDFLFEDGGGVITVSMSRDKKRLLLGYQRMWVSTTPFTSFTKVNDAPLNGVSLASAIFGNIDELISRNTATRGVNYQDITLNVNTLKTLPLVDADPYYKVESNWEAVFIKFQKDLQYEIISFFNDGTDVFPDSSILFNTKALTGTWTLNQIIIRDYDDGNFILNQTDIPTYYNMIVS